MLTRALLIRHMWRQTRFSQIQSVVSILYRASSQLLPILYTLRVLKDRGYRIRLLSIWDTTQKIIWMVILPQSSLT